MKGEPQNKLSLRANPRVTALIAASLACFIMAGITAYKLGQQSTFDRGGLGYTADLRVLTLEITAKSREATSGLEPAFNGLQEASQKARDLMQQFKVFEAESTSEYQRIATEVTAVSDALAKVSEGADIIVQNKKTIMFLHDVASTLNETIPELQQEYNNVVEILLENNAPADQIAVAQKQSWYAERIARNVDRMLEGGKGADQAADQFNLDASLFGSVLKGMLEGNVAMRISRVTDRDAAQSLEEINDLFEFVNGSVDEIFSSSPNLFKARKAVNDITALTPQLVNEINGLADHIRDLPGERRWSSKVALGFVALALLFLGVLSWEQYQGTTNRLAEEAQRNERNQEAILRLLDELADLADGDLTATATVTEDFTGAIADSINFTIDQLRILVSSINETAVAVSKAAQETQSTALHLAEASEHQAQEIAGASAAVNEMAVTIDQVSSNASESSAVAERSVDIAKTGAQVVQNTIHGMDTIREQIQDTSKRIKRLGESSQEIGDIVSLINDIADQTNILALNAAIQASMAGDAGRGFAVVADEVQRLAERSGAATKQIEALVKTIQTDTNEAVVSMEQTTSEVVRGARLAQDAGVALEEIENVSKSLAELIQNISNAARQQASSAGHISNTMNVIQEITSQTSAGTTATAKSIGNLSEMAIDLRNLVAGFKLPDEVRTGESAHANGEHSYS